MSSRFRSSTPSSTDPDRSHSPRFSMRLLLLLITCAGAWIAYFTASNSISTELSRIEVLHQFVPRLHARSSNEYACIEIDHTDSTREYHCYLPAGCRYRLNLKWKDAFPTRHPTAPDLSHVLKPGTYRIYFETSPSLRVRVDEEVVFDQPYQATSNPSSYTIVGQGTSFQGQWQDVAQPLVLLSRTEYNPQGPVEAPTLGVALWIDRVP